MFQSFFPAFSPYSSLDRHQAWVGFFWAILIILGWFFSLEALLLINFESLNILEIALAIVFRTVLQTGLFVIAHDAMHNSLFPRYPRLNDGLGVITLLLYVGLNYEYCRKNHCQHHLSPGGITDPDFCGNDENDRFLYPVLWYLRFIKNYLSLNQLFCLSGICFLCLVLIPILVSRSLPFDIPYLADAFSPGSFLAGGGDIPFFYSTVIKSTLILHLKAIVLFYILPLVLSSLQLFTFGTYLPHCPGSEIETLPHHSRSLNYPQWLSFLACYHFGYHWEHHQYPHLPWHQLPTVQGNHGKTEQTDSAITGA